MASGESESERSGLASKAIPAKDYLKQHPQPVILHFQPRAFVPMETPEELEQWETMVSSQVGLELPTASGISYTQTLSNPPPGQFEIPDDCEQD
jgi:hypothetical protein